MQSPELPIIPPITKDDCVENFNYWSIKMNMDIEYENYNEILDLSSTILPSHTFADRYLETNRTFFRPLLDIFGYDVKTKQFNPNFCVLKSLSTRNKSITKSSVPEHHMKTSKELGHEVFVFAYHGVHNPYQRKKDPPPIKPFGLFIKKNAENFAYCHGAPCDIARENPLVDRNNLRKYYLLPEHLRELKAKQICYADERNLDFWHYFGDPEKWRDIDEYGNTIYEKTGEFRYYESIHFSNIQAILWPCFVDAVLEGNIPDSDSDLELYSSFKRAYPDIEIIEYNLIDGDENNWPLALVEASFYSTKYYLKYGKYPSKAKFAKLEFQ